MVLGSTTIPKPMRVLARRMLRSSIWTLTSVALLFMVPRSTLGSAISKTEREIERSGDGRGRPAVLTNRQVKRIKNLAARWGAAGEEYNCEDIRQHLGLDVCLQTIRKALQKRGKVMFEFKPRVRKPTQSQADCAARLKFMLEMPEHWYDAVHGFVDQGEFPIPLCQRVPRSQSGWVQKGKELDPESVNFCATFKAPQLKFLLLWRGDRDVENNCVMSCPQYEKMSGESAFRMYKNNFWPALVRQYGEIEGPYVLQMDACKCLANGVDRFNEYMGREAIRVIFRGRDEEDPKAPGRLCDFWVTENVWSWVKRRLTKKVSKSPAFKKGVGLSLATRSPRGRRLMRQWANLVRPTIVKVPKSVLHGIYMGIPRRRDRIIAANGGAIGS